MVPVRLRAGRPRRSAAVELRSPASRSARRQPGPGDCTCHANDGGRRAARAARTSGPCDGGVVHRSASTGVHVCKLSDCALARGTRARPRPERPRRRLQSTRMKRFKAVVIGGTGYGGAELIRRLLIHPDVELVRVVAVDHVGEPLGAVHPPLTGRSAAALRERAARRGGRAAPTSRCSALPHKVSAHHAPGDPRGGREGRRHVGRLSPARRGRLRALLRRHAPAPRAAGHASSTACPS